MLFHVKLPHNTIQYRDITVREYKDILKSLLGSPNGEFLNEACVWRDIIKDTRGNNTLNFYEELYILLHLRQTSISDHFNISIQQEDKASNTTKDCNVALRVGTLIDPLESFLISIDKFISSPTIIDGIEFTLKFPDMFGMLSLEKLETYHFIHDIKINGNVIGFPHLDNDTKCLVYNGLPFAITQKLMGTLHKFLESSVNIPLAENKKLNFAIYIPHNRDDLFHLLKILFSTNLGTFYDVFYEVARHSNLSGEYLEKCIPAEFFLFASKYQESQAIISPPPDMSDIPGEF